MGCPQLKCITTVLECTYACSEISRCALVSCTFVFWRKRDSKVRRTRISRGPMPPLRNSYRFKTHESGPCRPSLMTLSCGRGRRTLSPIRRVEPKAATSGDQESKPKDSRPRALRSSPGPHQGCRSFSASPARFFLCDHPVAASALACSLATESSAR